MHTNAYAEDVESGMDVSVKFPRKVPYYELEFAFNNGNATSFFSKSLDSLEEMLTDAIISVQRAIILERTSVTELQEAVTVKLREGAKREVITEEGRVGDI